VPRLRSVRLFNQTWREHDLHAWGLPRLLALLRYNNASKERLLTDRWRILAKRTNLGIPNEINAVRSLRMTGARFVATW